MSFWQFAGHVAFAAIFFVWLLDTKWRRKLFKRHGEKL